MVGSQAHHTGPPRTFDASEKSMNRSRLPERLFQRGPLNLVALSLVFCFVSAAPLSASSAKSREYSFDRALVWEAAIQALQEQGTPIVLNDKEGGLITTDYSTATDQDRRYKFSLLLTTTGTATTVSVTCALEEYQGSGPFTAAGWRGVASDGTREIRLLESIAQRLDPSGATMNVPSPFCEANFAIGGSVVRGTSYSTFEDFSDVSQQAAFDAILASLGTEGLEPESSEAGSGTIQAIGTVARRENMRAEFTARPISGGVRVSASHKLRVGIRGRDDAVRDQLCRVIGGVTRLTRKPLRSSAAPGAGAPSPPATAPSGPSIEQRLRQVEDLYKKGLISEQEYKKKRAELLEQL